jgi:type II secretory pathway component GspD/PulD (secretin)
MADEPAHPDGHVRSVRREVIRNRTRDGRVRVLARPEFRAAIDLRTELRALKIEGLVVELILPRLDRTPLTPGAKAPPPEDSRLLFLGKEDVVERALEHLRRLDRPRRGIAASILITEVRARTQSARGGRGYFDRVQAAGGPDGLFRSFEIGFDPDAYLASSLSGARPFEGTDFVLADPDLLGGAWSTTLRFLLKEGEADYLAWPNLRLTEGQRGAIEAVEIVPVALLQPAGTQVARTVLREEEVGVRLAITPVRVGREEAVLDIDLWLRLAEWAQLPSSAVGAIGLRDRHVTTRVTVRDGEPLLFGGLFIRDRIAGRKQLPGISNLRILDMATRAEDRETVDTEMLMFVRVRIVDPDVPTRSWAVPDSKRQVAPTPDAGPGLPDPVIRVVPGPSAQQPLPQTP